MKTKSFLLFAVSLVTSLQAMGGNDDIYYFPSKHAEEKASVSQLPDTSGMTAYEKYRALKEGENANEANNNSASSPDTDNSRKPSYVVVNQDTTTGNVTINNYYFDDDRFGFYRRFYLDYYYYPYYYDPFLWEYSFWWGYPYAGFYVGYGYGYWGYWGYYPYYYSYYYPYYYGYWHGFYDGYYWRDYVTTQPRSGVYVTPGRRLGGYVNLSRRENASYYPGRFAANDYYHGSRRNGTTTVANSATSIPERTAVTRRSVSATTSNYNATSNVTTTRPYMGQQTRRSNYIPTYNTTTGERRAYSGSSSRNEDYIVVNNRRVKVVEVTQTSTPTPRRSNTTYTPTVRSGSSNSSNEVQTRRSSTEVHVNSPQPAYNAAPASRGGGAESHPSGTGRRR